MNLVPRLMILDLKLLKVKNIEIPSNQTKKNNQNSKSKTQENYMK